MSIEKIVCVPDSFKGSATAAQAAAALAAGARQVFPRAEVVELPFADGGEGTLDALLAVWGREPRASAAPLTAPPRSSRPPRATASRT